MEEGKGRRGVNKGMAPLSPSRVIEPAETIFSYICCMIGFCVVWRVSSAGVWTTISTGVISGECKQSSITSSILGLFILEVLSSSISR